MLVTKHRNKIFVQFTSFYKLPDVIYLKYYTRAFNIRNHNLHYHTRAYKYLFYGFIYIISH